MKPIKKIVKSIIKTLFLVFPIHNNRVIFCSFGGKSYGGNPKYIAEELIRKHPDMDAVWILKDPLQAVPKGMRKVRANSVRCLYEYRKTPKPHQLFEARPSHYL